MLSMIDLTQIIQGSTTHAWIYLPVAVGLGALHALEPGHAKSLMAAYLIAIRGTPSQAVTLGISAAIGHTFVVWIFAILALAFGQRYIVEEAEPWLTALSGVLIVLLAIRMMWLLHAKQHDHHGHTHEHDHHGHSHAPAHSTGQVI